MLVEQSRPFLGNPLLLASAGLVAVAAAFVIGRTARTEPEAPTLRGVALHDVAGYAEGEHPPASNGTKGAASAGPAASLSSEEHLAIIEAEFAKESSAAAWNPAGELRSKLTAMLPPGSAIRALECRRSMCRLETVHRDMDTYRRFSEGFRFSTGTPLWSGATVFDVRQPARDSDEVVAIGYLARESLPSPTTH